MTKQMTKIAMIMVLAMGLMTSAAMAQKNNGDDIAGIGIYTGVESSEGRLDAGSGMVYGNTFVLTSHGEWETHHLTISLDYQSGIVANNFTVTGGSWSLVIFRDNKFAGSMSGEVESGQIVIATDADGEPYAKQVTVNLSSSSNGKSDGKAGKKINGVYNAITDMRSRQRETAGNLAMQF